MLITSGNFEGIVMLKVVKSCLLSCALLAGSAHADGSETASLGVASMLMGSAMIVGGSLEVIADSVAASAELVVASVEVAGEVVIITLEAGAESAEQIIIHASAAGHASAALAVGTVITASAVTVTSAAGASILLGHILLHGAEVLLFIPHGDLAVGLHSHKL